MSADARRAFVAAAATIQSAFVATSDRGAEVTPELLAAAAGQFCAVFDRVDRDRAAGSAFAAHEASTLGEQALGCIADLALWADRVGCAPQRPAVEALALDIAQWVMRHGGEIRVLEPIVNALAQSANTTQAPAQLAMLYRLMRDIIEHVADSVRNDPSVNPAHPWRIINFNCAIVATRTQDPMLMNTAYDGLERNLPGDCPAFFEEGVCESGKKVYGEPVRTLLQERFDKWTTRH